MPSSAFPLTSEQLALLLTFESSDGLSSLAERLGRDPSVISRNLQRLAEDAPVLEKSRGRWQITPLGRRMNTLTRTYLSELSELLADVVLPVSAEHVLADRSLLIVVNAQSALSSPDLGPRSNDDAEQNISKLLGAWRQREMPIIHVKHVSDDPRSKFFRGSKGAAFLPLLTPESGELVVEKTRASAFAGTALAGLLQERQIEALVISGFTTNECIDATARDSSDLGLTTYVAGDGTAMFDVWGPDGTVYKADRVHHLALANIHALSAKVMDTEALLRLLPQNR